MCVVGYVRDIGEGGRGSMGEIISPEHFCTPELARFTQVPNTGHLVVTEWSMTSWQQWRFEGVVAACCAQLLPPTPSPSHPQRHLLGSSAPLLSLSKKPSKTQVFSCGSVLAATEWPRSLVFLGVIPKVQKQFV